MRTLVHGEAGPAFPGLDVERVRKIHDLLFSLGFCDRDLNFQRRRRNFRFALHLILRAQEQTHQSKVSVRPVRFVLFSSHPPEILKLVCSLENYEISSTCALLVRRLQRLHVQLVNLQQRNLHRFVVPVGRWLRQCHRNISLFRQIGDKSDKRRAFFRKHQHFRPRLAILWNCHALSFRRVELRRSRGHLRPAPARRVPPRSFPG